ncbi:universal stress protein [bacterium]|nr:MAG: universal stress protein [bacterium]
MVPRSIACCASETRSSSTSRPGGRSIAPKSRARKAPSHARSSCTSRRCSRPPSPSPATSGAKGRAMFKTALVPLDGSEQSQAALEIACTIAGEQHGRLVLISAVDVSSITTATATPYVIADPAPLIAGWEAEAQRILADGARIAQGHDVPAETRVVEDAPVAAILDAAAAFHADLIVMGTHGRSGLARAFLGSRRKACCAPPACRCWSHEVQRGPPRQYSRHDRYSIHAAHVARGQPTFHQRHIASALASGAARRARRGAIAFRGRLGMRRLARTR